MLIRVIPLALIGILTVVVATTTSETFVYTEAFLKEISENVPLMDGAIEYSRPFLSFIETSSAP
jgi:hypothetical protein